MDSEAASANNKIDLFISDERFPEVFEARQAVADADATLVRPAVLYHIAHARTAPRLACIESILPRLPHIVPMPLLGMIMNKD